MFKKLFLAATMMATCMQLNAQNVAPNYKVMSNNNPISPCVFCADPTALEYNGRLYVYGTNDHQQFIKNGKKNGNGYGDIKSIVVFSTDDMVNWTFHGTIDVGKLCSSWGWRFAASWAPSVTWRTTEDGTEEFFLYFANSGGSVGVLKANSPIGPWISPLSKPMIDADTPGVRPCHWIFDPGVIIDENGTGWIAFGGGDPQDKGTDLQPNNARFAKLMPSMTAIDGQAVKIPAPYHFEASELNIMDGKFVYTYCSSWAERKDADWNAYLAEHGINYPKPASCTMCYMVNADPMNPDTWTYKGVCGPHPGFPSPNNHSHLQKFQGNYYYFYHWGPLMKSMIDANAIDSSCDGYRSICVNLATVSEETQNIKPVVQELSGVTEIRNMNPYQLQEAETMANCGGVSYEDFTNIQKNTRVSTLGNDASRNMQVQMRTGSWITQRRVDFGTTGAAKYMLRAKGTGTLEIRVGRIGAKAAGTVNISSTEMEDYTIEVDASKLQGVKNVFFVVTSADDLYVDAWQFTEAQNDGIQVINSNENIKSHNYDISGRRLDEYQNKGIVIEQYTDEKGVKHSRKTLHKQQ